MHCEEGDWVQIHSVVLQPGSRAPQVPDDTQKVPLEMWCKGFALNKAEIGAELSIRTVNGIVLSGTLTAVNPRYEHDFGSPVRELMTIGMELRRMLKEVN